MHLVSLFVFPEESGAFQSRALSGEFSGEASGDPSGESSGQTHREVSWYLNSESNGELILLSFTSLLSSLGASTHVLNAH